MDCEFTLGQAMIDKTPSRVRAAWGELCELWMAYASVPRHPDSKSGVAKLDSTGKFIGWTVRPSTPFISPFLLKDGAVGKTKENVVGSAAWFGLDVDRGWTLDRLENEFAGYQYFLHTTTRHRDDDPHLRANVTLTRPLADETEYQLVWHYFNDRLFGIDPQTKNINRLLYVPSQWQGAANEYRVALTGSAFDVDAMMAMMADKAPALTVGTTASADRLEGTPFDGRLINGYMENQFRASPEGGRLFVLMLRMGGRAARRGWAVTAHDLETEACAFDRLVTGKRRVGAYREAERALGIVASWNTEPLAGAVRKGLNDQDALRAAMRRFRFTKKR